jgi:hypothetical protein
LAPSATRRSVGASLIAMVIVVALIALIYIVPRGGRRRR